MKLYSSKYSKYFYTRHQLLILVLLKEYISTDYRDFAELIDLMSDIKENLALDKIPHFTTLQKFVTRLPSSLFNLLLQRILKLFYSYGENVSVAAIDATNLRVISKLLFSQKNGKLRRSFLRTSILADTSKKVILGCKLVKKQTMKSNMQSSDKTIK